ncbi:hypothetical protein GCM10023184_03880 [Flaviaesturariibacter amylovorans]|uniref:Type II secretion system protein GspG C-terminal domain-containing protein n=1 Tax=Flaviaesturariibacter amylovorans TaxID=1084520 RepID=A0ABP8G7X0_9BACT
MVGAFVGLGLILYGIFRYKDKWLVLIGAFGILFTVGVYTTLFAIGTTMSKSRSLFASLSQMHLNSLVKDVEFYKLQYGQYPDSLQEVPKDQLAPIHDPTQANIDEPMQTFYYKRVGDGYHLCSKGVDKVLGTADDLYPNIYLPDRSKVGFTRRAEAPGQQLPQ